MTTVDLHHGAATDVGLVRIVNEDNHLVAPPVFVVADGMGGHRGGDIASQVVVDEFARAQLSGLTARAASEEVLGAFTRAQSRLRQWAEGHPDQGLPARIGTTVVLATLVTDEDAPKWLLVNLGDSRIYKLLDERLEQVSVDHSVVQELVEAGSISVEEAARHPERHVVTRALGSARVATPDFFLLPLGAAERLLLCTDGVSGMIDDEQIRQILVAKADPRDAADALVAAAIAAGGRDNATAIVVDVMGLARDAGPNLVRQRGSLESRLGARS